MLPKISSSDKQIRYNGMKSGDICRITRSNETTGFYTELKLVR